MKKKMLWFLWAPLILIGVIALILLGIFIAGRYSVEYEDDGQNAVETSFENSEKFYVTSDYELVAGDENLRTIAGKFNGYIEMITGFGLRTADKKSGARFIELKVDEKAEDDYSFRADVNDNIYITADSLAHLTRAVYAFLEQFGGLRCYTSQITESLTGKIFFPKEKDGYKQTYNDYFEMRNTDWISAKDDEYSLFRGFNSDDRRFEVSSYNPSAETEDEARERIASQKAYYDSLGGCTQYISGFCHTFANQFLNPSEYYDKGLELECYALDSKGRRRRDELCLSNPRTLEIVTREVFDILEGKDRNPALSGKAYNPDAPLQIISLTQADDLTACKCRECVACAKKHGGYSAPNLLFVNKVAQAVKDAGYNNVAIDTFAYRYTRKAPSDIVPLDNVIIRLCSIECCCSHYMDDEKCLSNRAFMKDLDDWSKICDRIYIWDYCTDFSYFMTVFPDFNTLAHNIRVFYEHSVKGVYEEGNYTTAEKSPDFEFAELRSYLISKCLENPYCDYEAAMREFCGAYYGEAGEDIFTFIKKADTYAGRKHLNIYKKPSLVLSCSKAELEELNSLFEHAKSVATGEAAVHVRRSELSWRYFKMYKRIFEFKKAYSFELEREHLFLELGEIGACCLHEVEANYKLAGLSQTAMIDFRPAFDAVVGKFVYGP